MSPDGQYVLVARIKRPFSRLVTAGGFPKDVEVWNRKGEVAAKIAEQPLGEGVPIGGVTAGPRAYRWQADAAGHAGLGRSARRAATRGTRCRPATRS